MRLTHEEAVERVRIHADNCPSRAWFARTHGFSGVALSHVLTGGRPLSPRIAAAVGLKPTSTHSFRGVARHKQPKRYFVEAPGKD